MKGDFTRDSFNPAGGFTRVLQQQGRIESDADGNERAAIQLRFLRQLAADVIGPHGGPKGAFRLSEAHADVAFDFTVAPGIYYVDGWRIENPAVVHYRGNERDCLGQPGPQADQPKQGTYLAWLDVRERHLSALEYDGPLKPNDPRRLADPALGGRDTASRGQVVWSVRLAEVSPNDAADLGNGGGWVRMRDTVLPPARGLLTARAVDRAAPANDDPNVVGRTPGYKGLEDRLYRIEIWQGGTAAEGARFVWSRENGSVLYRVETIDGSRVSLARGQNDGRTEVGIGDIVSIEGSHQRCGAPAQLFEILHYDAEAIAVDLDGAPNLIAEGGDVVLRRWDHRQSPASIDAGHLIGNAIAVTEATWITLEDGISVRFAPGENAPAHYRVGDYWLVPARTAIGDILWGSDGVEMAAVPPHGIERVCAPLGLVRFDAQGNFSLDLDLRREFAALTG